MKRYCFYGHSGYNRRSFMEVPLLESNLENNPKALNRAMSLLRVMVQWIFMQVKLYSTVSDFQRKMLITEAQVSTIYVRAMLLTKNDELCVREYNFAVLPPILPLTLASTAGRTISSICGPHTAKRKARRTRGRAASEINCS